MNILLLLLPTVYALIHSKPHHRSTATAATASNHFTGSTVSGDYAGHVATFQPDTGKLLPVPEHFLPETLIEWNQIPSSFELLTSEDVLLLSNNGEKEKKLPPLLKRIEIKVVPDVGCGVDNLDTLVQNDSISIHSMREFDAASSLLYKKSETNSILETIFISCEPEQNLKKDENGISYPKRIRITLAIKSPIDISLSTPIKVTVERMTSAVSSQGTLVNGGGLSASTVTRLIGIDNVNKPFSDTQAINLDRLVGKWKVFVGTDEEEVVYIKKQDLERNQDNVCTLFLPGNIIVRHGHIRDNGSFQWIAEISIVEEEEKVKLMRRRVIKRTFARDGSSAVRYWEEIKET